MSSLRPASPACAIISVEMPSGPGAFLNGIPFSANSTYVYVIRDKSLLVLISGISPLLTSYTLLT